MIIRSNGTLIQRSNPLPITVVRDPLPDKNALIVGKFTISIDAIIR